MSEVARKYREIAAELLELAKDVGTKAERDACIAFSLYCLGSARAVEGGSELADVLRGNVRARKVVKPGGRIDQP